MLPDVGKIALADATFIEEPNDSDREDDGKQQKTVFFAVLCTQHQK